MLHRFTKAAGVLLLVATGRTCLSNDTPWLDVPFVRQVKSGCGSAAIAMVMQYWVKHQPRIDLAAADAERINKALPPSSKGLYGKELKQYLETHSFTAFVFNGTLSDLRDHASKGRPVIVCLGFNRLLASLHYVVVVGISEDELFLNDPARGKLVREEKAAFLRAWKTTGNWALLAVPRPAP